MLTTVTTELSYKGRKLTKRARFPQCNQQAIHITIREQDFTESKISPRFHREQDFTVQPAWTKRFVHPVQACDVCMLANTYRIHP